MNRRQWLIDLVLIVIFACIAIFVHASHGQDRPTAATAPVPSSQPTTQEIRYIWVDVFIDSGATPLAAYQIEFLGANDSAALVGVEGGEHPAFAAAPYYDPALLKEGRLIVAAFSTSDDLPKGRTRVVRIHLKIEGSPHFSANLMTAGSSEAKRIEASVSVVEGVTP